MKLTHEQRQAMIGKRYAKDDIKYFATVHDVERYAGGFTVKYMTTGSNNLQYMGLQKFLKIFPHEI
ncbi:hypothetical protein SP069_00405 [Salmonella phage SP069]|uniref:Uncharacterized protein n=2 Tax=Nonanavirus TaxID=1921122 RepID=S4TW35_9CAUD|nr:hypothetical protein QII00_sBgp17 [Salmonella phage SP069]AGF89297.1 hypothetical protein SP062_00085 [Salmonella phage FSL SP-062]AGF89580.1 hypothetical protein SP069_00405 [Salmonella phage SP069]